MSLELPKIREMVRESLSNIRAISRIVESTAFGEAFSKADVLQKMQAVKFVSDNNLEYIKEWLRCRTAESKTLGEKTVVELRKIGQSLGVRDYFKLPKTELLSAIAQATQRSESKPSST